MRAADDLAWPELDLAAWRPTRDTLHLWTQVVGKVRLALAAPLNHWWHVPLYVTARGLSTSAMPVGDRSVEATFDFQSHRLEIACSDGARALVPLRPISVADFYAETLAAFRSVGVDPDLWPVPVELPDPIPFEQDRTHCAYDPVYAQRFWRVLLTSSRVMERFRGEFLGKSSPVHFFWGSFDLAVSRFSGREAPPHPGAPNVADRVTREAYSHEVASAGFWPGGNGLEQPIFYAYACPTPPGFSDAKVEPSAASWNADFGEWVLPYSAVRAVHDPEQALTDFLQGAYVAAADLLRWDRAALERSEPTS